MKKIYTFILSFVFIFQLSYSQSPGEWMWIHGSNTVNSAGTFGTQGVPSPTNEPPSFYEPIEWTDLDGNFWFYGGEDYLSGDHNDLWRYNPVSNEWTWMTGTHTSNDLGNYGTQGVPSSTNRPPSRSWGAVSWTDKNNNLWMFGGLLPGGAYSDLWRYSISTNEWTWMKGPNTRGVAGVYGTITVPDAANNPGARTETAGGWTDNSGNLWLFGGLNYGAGGVFNDVWRYNISTNIWTWMKGTQGVASGAPTYGAKGVEASTNTPGGIKPYARWTDNNSNFWFFGGQGPPGDRNDMWRFNPATNNWTWMNGSGTANGAGSHGTRCIADTGNAPHAMFENRAAMTDQNGNLWMFGGGESVSFPTVWNGLWMYCVSSNKWTWEGGDATTNPTGSWGTINVSSPSNKPDGRAGNIGWADKSGYLYIFAGVANGYPSSYNDVWKFRIDTSCAVCASTVIKPVANFTSSDTILCANDCINLWDPLESTCRHASLSIL